MKKEKNAQRVDLEKSNWYVLEVKVTGLLMFSTPQVTDHTGFSLSRVEKKWSHTVSYLTTPLTQNKQEHPKRQQILFHSHSWSLSNTVWVRCQCCPAILCPYSCQIKYLRIGGHMRTDWKQDQVWQISLHMTEQRWWSRCLWLFWLTQRNSVLSCKTYK